MSLTVAEYAEKHDVSGARVRQWIKEGRLVPIRENPYLLADDAPRPAGKQRGADVSKRRGRKGKESPRKKVSRKVPNLPK